MEVIKDGFSIVGDKALGPDGFSMAFFKLVGKFDIMGAFHEFHENGRFEKSLNATFIDLIPKKPGVVEVKDY